jgi:septal ring factor EnvC (AmiA/AmiB activator)
MTPESPSADLLAFPSRPEDRLRRALRQLEAALAEQSAAVAGFRADLASLSTAVAGLDNAVQDYRGQLVEVAGAAQRAQRTAHQLEDRAEAMLRG